MDDKTCRRWFASYLIDCGGGGVIQSLTCEVLLFRAVQTLVCQCLEADVLQIFLLDRVEFRNQRSFVDQLRHWRLKGIDKLLREFPV